MTRHETTTLRLTGEDPQLVRLVDEITDRLETGRPLDLNEFVAAHPAHERDLRRVFPAIQALVGLAAADGDADSTSSSGEEAVDRTLGDFRIVRELGRGGMGVVYEAEQISIGRRVALKVLPFAAMLDKQQLNRFKNEARAAGTLDHPNIVAVHSVGTERGVHYYAMQLIDGQSLAEIIAELRKAQGKKIDAADAGDRSVVANGVHAPQTEPTQDAPEGQSTDTLTGPSADTKRVAQAALSTLPAFDSREFFRNVAQLGIQAAGALDHAHRNGILHRDIKPGNLLLDSDGNLWITDFGLARIEADAGMTMTGDVLGTLRYMAPEQALGERGVVDHRADIYSLGATLYELLTLQPALQGSGRPEMLRKIAEEEPCPPRRLNRAIPADLETIVLTAMAKEPQGRYATAGEFAADLQRFLEDQPIRARWPSLATRVLIWSRRHKSVVRTTAALLLVAGILGGWIAWDRVTRQQEVARLENQRLFELQTAAQEAVTAAGISLAQEQYDLTVGRLVEARSRLADAPESLLPLRQQIDKLLAKAEDQRRVRRFRHLANEARTHAYFDRDRDKTRLACEEALDSYNVASATVDNRSDRATAAEELPAELRDDAFELLLILARARFYIALGTNRTANAEILEKALATLDQARRLRSDSPALYLYRAEFFKRSGDEAAASAEQQRAAEAEPRTALDHFWLGESGKGDRASHYRSAVELDARHAPSYMRLGQHYKVSKQPEEAKVCFAAYLALLPEGSFGYQYRGMFYREIGELAKAIADFTKALQFRPDFWAIYSLRGYCHRDLGDFQRAVNDFTVALKALEVVEDGNHRAAGVCWDRGRAYVELGDFEAATADFDRAAQWQPLRFGEDVAKLFGQGPKELRDVAKALALLEANIEVYRKRLVPAPKHMAYRNNLANHLHVKGQLLEANGRLDEAEQTFAEFLTIYVELADEFPEQKSFIGAKAEGHNRLITVLQKSNQWKKAATLFGEAQKLKHDAPHWLSRLSWWLATWPDEKLRDPPRAIELAKRAIELEKKAKKATETQKVNAGYWSNLGTAHYRAGNWPEAITALEKYNEHVHDAFFLAMAHWQLGDKDQARKYFDEAVERMEKHEHDDEELVRFRAEAKALLELEEDK